MFMTISGLSMKMVMDILIMADQFLVARLKELCEKRLIDMREFTTKKSLNVFVFTFLIDSVHCIVLNLVH